MSDPDSQWWLIRVLAALMGIIASIGEVYRRRVDKINENYVSREDLESYLDKIRDDRQRQHQENLDGQHEIRDSIQRVHQRIDALYK